MRTLSISLDLDAAKVSEVEKEEIKKFGYALAFETLLNQGLASMYREGLPIIKGKILARIQSKLDKLRSDELDLSLDESEFDLVKEVFLSDDTKFNVQQYRLVTQIIENVEACRSR